MQEDGCDAGEVQRSQKVHVYRFGVSWIVSDAFDSMVGIEPVAVLEDPGAGDCVIDVAVFVVRLFEELVQVGVFCHVALNKGDGRAGFASGFEVGVDVAEDDEGAMLY